MAADRKNYVMSVEFAMQREMAYKKKLRGKGVNPTSNHALPSQDSPVSQIGQVLVPASSQVPRTTPAPVLPPNSASRPTVRPVPIPTPGLIGPRPMQAPVQRANSLHVGPTTGSTQCLNTGPISNTIPTPYSGPRPIQSPILQRPNVQYNRPIIGPTPVLRSPPSQGSSPRPDVTHDFAHQKTKKPLHQPPKAENYRCNLCDVYCNSAFNLRMHLRGQKHKAKLRDARSMKLSSGVMSSQQQGAKQPKYCGLCEVWCTDENSYRLHRDGKNHISKCHAAEKRMKMCQ